MAENLTDQVREIAQVTSSIAGGDLTKTIEVQSQGEILDLKNTVNGMVAQLRVLASEVIRVSTEVGTEGRLGGQANVPNLGGSWTLLTTSVNEMAANLTAQVRGIALVTTAVARGDLTKTIVVTVAGEMADLKVITLCNRTYRLLMP